MTVANLMLFNMVTTVFFIGTQTGSWKINKEDPRRNSVYAFLNLIPKAHKNFIFNHFRNEQVSKSTVYIILQRKEKNIGSHRYFCSGPPAEKMPKNKVNQQIKRIFHEDWVSQHRLARQNGIGKSYVSRIINKEKSIKNRKKKKAPKHCLPRSGHSSQVPTVQTTFFSKWIFSKKANPGKSP